MAASEPQWVRFRTYVHARLDELAGADRYGYIDAEHATHTCPVCKATDGGAFLGITWHGETPRAHARCSRGCTPQQIAVALKLDVTACDGHDLLMPRQTLLPNGWAREAYHVETLEWPT